MEWLTALGALAGVFLGARLTARSTEASRLRDLRIERYIRIIHMLDNFNLAFDKVLETYASPERFGSSKELTEAIEARLEPLSEISGEVRAASAELSLFTSPGVSQAIREILVAWDQMLNSLARLLVGGDGADDE